MTLKEEVTKLRSLIKEVSDDSKYTDQLLYSIWLDSRATVLRNQISQGNYISENNYQTFCVELVSDKSHLCGCVEYGCDVLRSKYPIPNSIVSRSSDTLEVLTLGHRRIGITDETNRVSDSIDEIKSKKVRASIINRYIIIFNSGLLKTIRAKAIWEDIVKWQDIQQCTDTDPCKDVFDLELGLSAALSDQTQRLVLQKLQLPLTRPDDAKEDRNSEVRGRTQA